MNTGDRFRAHARATHLFDQVAAALQQFAATRRAMKLAGIEMPDNVRAELLAVRRLLHNGGLSQAMIDTMPGLQLPEHDDAHQARAYVESLREAGYSEQQIMRMLGLGHASGQTGT